MHGLFFAAFDHLFTSLFHAETGHMLQGLRLFRLDFLGGAERVFLAKRQASGLDEATDTTDAMGVARTHLQVKPGQYWVYARYELVYTELYWNVMITVERGEPIQVRLTRENADERIKL